MSPILIAAATIISLALVAYTIAFSANAIPAR